MPGPVDMKSYSATSDKGEGFSEVTDSDECRKGHAESSRCLAMLDSESPAQPAEVCSRSETNMPWCL